PATNAGPQGTGTGTAADWLAWSSERFQEIMRKLAEGAAPPDARQSKAAKQPSQEDATGQPKAQPEKSPDVAAKSAPGTAPAPPSAVQPTRQQPGGGEERKITETRRAETAKREAEVKKTEDVLRAEQQRKAAEETAKKSNAARRSAEAKAGEEAGSEAAH